MKAAGQVSFDVTDGSEVTDAISEIRKSSEVTNQFQIIFQMYLI